MKLTQKLINMLHRGFDRSPHRVLAFRLRYDGEMSWVVEDQVLTTSVTGGSGRALEIDLTQFITINDLVLFLGRQPGYSVLSVSQETVRNGAVCLLDAAGDQGRTNGDHLYAFTSIVWAYLDACAVVLKAARDNIRTMPAQMSLNTAEAFWMDELGRQYGIRRRQNEPDRRYGSRIIAEILRPKSNNIAIEEALLLSVGTVGTQVPDAPEQQVRLADGSGTAMSYGLFDVLFNGDQSDFVMTRDFYRDAMSTINTFRSSGCHLRKFQIRYTSSRELWFMRVNHTALTYTVPSAD